MLLCLVAAWTVGVTTARIPVYHLVCALGFVFLGDLLCGFLLRGRVDLHGRLPDRMMAGEAAVAEFTLESKTKRSGHDVGLCFLSRCASLQQTDRDMTLRQLPPRASGRIMLRIEAPRRGLISPPDLHVCSAFPLNLWRNSMGRFRSRPVLVLPCFHPLISIDVPMGRRYQPGGVSLTSNIGESPEYIGNREYRPGDPTRWIDFRSWARLARPVVKEYQEEYYCRIALVLDTFIQPGRRRAPAGFPELEAAISLAAAVADTLSREEYLIDLFAAGPDLYVFRAGRSIAHFENILEILACVDACRSNPFDSIAPALVDELVNITAVIFVLLDWDETRARFVRQAVEAGCSAKVVIVRQGDASESFAEAEDWAGAITPLTPDEISQGAVETL
ncbi:MAG: DUF58 domain-containing protein [Armatimonadetes bacterium]|nr:DUF58 domain-containing protein [Armatimonadota bacterium]